MRRFERQRLAIFEYEVSCLRYLYELWLRLVDLCTGSDYTVQLYGRTSHTPTMTARSELIYQ